MSVIKRMRRQKAIWWARLTPNKFGKYSFADPVEISCRWDDGGEEVRDATGQNFIPRATVYVDRVIAVGDRLKKGELESDTPDDPLEAGEAYEVKRFATNPNFRNTENLYTVIL
jgi:hypothetical protein